jgi:hypothetical protein
MKINVGLFALPADPAPFEVKVISMAPNEEGNLKRERKWFLNQCVSNTKLGRGEASLIPVT